ncbi:MAG: hypothetical protein NZU63_12015 [Gemmataceae bacterium]|nr:hypothetical protein [Gemmataceae bacterium]MDW8244395.1 hypothetical protein [Thermogemmata sp.]
MAILILGSHDDVHACHVYHYLRERYGADVELVDSRWFPTQMQLHFEPEGPAGFIRLPSGRLLAWPDIQAVYWRCSYGAAVAPLPDPQQRFIAEYDASGLLDTFLKDLPARWVNGWQAQQLHRTKPVQLARVARLGAIIPATIVSNDPEQIRQFATRHPHCIFKPVQGGAHAQRLEPRHLTEDHLELLRVAPVTVQEEIPGTNVRVFVAGEQVLACEIQTPHLDYRDDPHAQLLVHSLPPEIAALCRRIAETLELLWTGIDFRLTPDGRYVFLEANPSPMFLGFEQATGLPLTAALADLLLHK